MARVDPLKLKRMGEAQKMEDDDLYVDITKSRKLAKEQLKEEKDEETPEDERKDTIKLLIVIGIVVAIIAVFVVLFLLRQPEKVMTIDELHEANLKGKLKPEQGYIYNGYSFVKFGPVWYTQIQKNTTTYSLSFNYDPRSVENITVDGQLTQNFIKNKHVYMTFDPEGNNLGQIRVAYFGLSMSLIGGFGYDMTTGCTKNVTKACQDAGIITCEDTTKAVIYFKEDNETKITLNNNCVTIQGEGAEIVRAKDRLLLRWYGIIN